MTPDEQYVYHWLSDLGVQVNQVTRQPVEAGWKPERWQAAYKVEYTPEAKDYAVTLRIAQNTFFVGNGYRGRGEELLLVWTEYPRHQLAACYSDIRAKHEDLLALIQGTRPVQLQLM